MSALRLFSPVDMDAGYFLNRLYPLQDKVLQVIDQAQTGLYLTGGTALSRGYLNHRFSDDLDLFANMDERFGTWCSQVQNALSASSEWSVRVQRQAGAFLRLIVTQADVELKIECVNDVPSHIGQIQQHPVLGRLDSAENILANKLTALAGREEPKDVADVWGLCHGLGLPINVALTNADSKAAGLYPPYLARRLFLVTREDWEAVRWITAPEPDEFIREVKGLAESLILIE